MRTKTKKEPTVDVLLDLAPDLRAKVKAAARNSGMSMNEFMVDVIQANVRRGQQYDQSESRRFTPHGGKHKSGMHTGYEETEDGKYYPAPSWVQRFELLFSERAAIYNLTNTVITHAQERLVHVEQNLIKAKAALIEDLGLDPEKQWSYYGAGNYLQEDKKEAEKEAAATEGAGGS